MYTIVSLSSLPSMMSLMVMSGFDCFLNLFFLSSLWKVMMMLGGVVFEVLVVDLMTARRQVKSVVVSSMFFRFAMLMMILLRSSFSVLGMSLTMSCRVGSCRGLGWAVGWDTGRECRGLGWPGCWRRTCWRWLACRRACWCCAACRKVL